MTLRERIADWITGGALTLAKTKARAWEAQYAMAKHAAKEFEADAFEWNGKAIDARAEAANIAAQRDEAIAQATTWHEAFLLADEELAFAKEQEKQGRTALRAILTARNITEARKIAKQALGDE